MDEEGDIINGIVDRLLTFECRLLQCFTKNIHFLSSQFCHLLELHESQDIQSFIRHVSLVADLSSVQSLVHELEVYLATTTDAQSKNQSLTLTSMETLSLLPDTRPTYEQKIDDYISYTERFKRVIATCKLVFALFDTKKLKLLSRHSSNASAAPNSSSNIQSTTLQNITEGESTHLSRSSTYNYDDLEVHCIKKLLRCLGPLDAYNHIEVRRLLTPSPTTTTHGIGPYNATLSSSMSSSSTFGSNGSFGSDLDVLATLVDLLNDSFPDYDNLTDKLVDNDHLLYQGFKLFFPKGQFLQASSLFYLVIPYLQQTDKHDPHSLHSILTKFEDLLPPYFDIEFPQAANEQLIYDIVVNYTQILPPKTKVFKLSIIKEFMFNPESILERDDYYENSILRTILSNEVEDYPHSFDELSLKVIDIMEYLMFYLDSLKVILKIYDKVQVTLAVKSQILSIEDHLEEYQVLVSTLEETNRELGHELNLYVQGGTKGLSKWQVIPYTIEVLKKYHGQLYDINVRFQWLIDKLPKIYPHPGSIILKDEHHFIKVVDYYLREFSALFGLFQRDIIEEVGKLQQNTNTEEDVDDDEEFNDSSNEDSNMVNYELEAKTAIISGFIELKSFVELDSLLKSEFFQRINLFSFRFIFEDLITRLLDSDSEGIVVQSRE